VKDGAHAHAQTSRASAPIGSHLRDARARQPATHRDLHKEFAGLPRDDSDQQEDTDGRLSPWANLVTGAPGWQVTARSRRLVVAVAALSGGTVHPHEKGGWQARLPQAVLMVVVTGADTGTLWCRLSAEPDPGLLALVFAPWPAATVLRCPIAALPARGRLSVRAVRVTTRMGRTVRYLVPTFTPS
jgi:hypothetical protein